ncbi:MAG: hypothetical protein GY777_26865 [Candidatus Brocadiaceae bacterium]|nr:hypothetical protein [Candidatus Brocadiaceae bacterium]
MDIKTLKMEIYTDRFSRKEKGVYEKSTHRTTMEYEETELLELIKQDYVRTCGLRENETLDIRIEGIEIY